MTMALMIPQTAYLARQGDGAAPHVTPSEVAKLLQAAPTAKTRLLIKILAATGARISEILDIRADDLDVSRAVVRLRRRKRRKDWVQEVPITADLANELNLWRKAKRLRGHLFSGNRQVAWRSLRDLGKKVLGRAVSPKEFRHAKGYEMAERGTHPLLMARALGHSNINNVIYYYHPKTSDLREAMGATSPGWDERQTELFPVARRRGREVQAQP